MQMLHEEVVQWTEDFKFPGARKTVEVDAKSFNAWVHENWPLIDSFPVCQDQKKSFSQAINIDEKHKFIVKTFSKMETYNPYAEMCGGFIPMQLIPRGSDQKRRRHFDIFNASSRASVIFKGTPIVPILFKNTSFDGWQPIMSITPMEIMTLRPLVRKAKGRVLIGGLGLGYLTRKVLQRKKVKEVVVVEQNEHLIAFFGKFLLDEFGDRVKIIKGDMYTHPWGDFDVALWDIWDGIADAPWDRKFQQIKQSMHGVGKSCIGWTDWASRRYS